MRLATLLLTLLALPAAAQAPGTYAVFASQADLDDGGTLSGAVPTCLLAGAAQGISGAFFWDATSQVFAIYDATAAPGERTTVPVNAFLIDLAAGTNVTTCRDAVPELDADGVPTGVAFLVLSNADNEDFVARVDAQNQGFSVLTDRGNGTDAGDGISGITQAGTTLYLARQQFFGAPEDGIYFIDTTTEDQVPAVLLTDADLDLTAIAYDSGLNSFTVAGLYAVSSEFGEGDAQNVLLFVDPDQTAPMFNTVAAPCAGTDPLFTNCEDGGLEDLAIGVTQAGDIDAAEILVSNNSFGGPDGEVVGRFLTFDPRVEDSIAMSEIVFSEADLIAQTGVSGFSTSGSAGYLAFTDARTASTPTLYMAGSDQFSGAAGIYSVTTPVFVASETAPEGAFTLAVAPNPAIGAARLSVTTRASGALTIDVVDALGRSVGTLFSAAAAAGQTLSLATPTLAPGVYTVRVQSAVGIATERFTVAR